MSVVQRPGTDRAIEIAPSVLPVDFAHLGDAVVELEKAGVDRIQWDVMDGRFVPNLTFGPDVIASTRDLVTVPFEAHLMVEEPDELAHRYVEAGCRLLIVHAEACTHLHRTLGHIRELGAAPGGGAQPGHAGERGPTRARSRRDGARDDRQPGVRWPGVHLDDGTQDRRAPCGGSSRVTTTSTSRSTGASHPTTAAGAASAGANVLVAGSALFRDPEGLDHATAEIRRVGQDAANAVRHPRWMVMGAVRAVWRSAADRVLQ